MKMKYKKVLGLFVLLTWCLTIIAGNDAKWKASFAKEISWMKVTDVGVPVVATEDGLYGINPEDGTIQWKNEDLKKLIVETYEPLAGTPFIIITPEAQPVKAKTGFAAMAAIGSAFNKGYVIIINALDGTIACDTRAFGMTKLTGQKSLPELNAIVFQGVKGEKLKDRRSFTIFYDFNTNAKLWQQEYYLEEAVPLTVIDSDNLIATGGTGYSLINAKTGAIKYKTEIKFKDGGAPNMVFNNERTVVYYVNKKFGNAYNLSDGSKLWKTPIDMDDPASHVFTDHRGIYIAVGKNINLYDYNTGQPKWGKDGIKLYDPLYNYVFTDKGLGIQMIDEDNYSVNILNFETGKPFVKKAVKLKAPAVDLRMVSKGLLYRSSVELNILDAETGKPSFDKSIKFKDPVIVVDKGDHTYMFTGKQFYDFNNQTCTYVNKSIDTKFEGKETPTSIELRDNGILLKSAQNLTLFDLNGNSIYHVFYEAPGQSLAMKIALGAMATASAALAVSASMNAQSSSNFGNQKSNWEDASKNAGNAASSGFKAMGKRFTASKEADGYVTMLTKISDGLGVVKINKDNGNKEAEVLLKEKEPVYEIDELGGMLFFKSKKTEVSGFKF